MNRVYKFLIILGMIHGSICHTADPSLTNGNIQKCSDENQQNNAFLIQQTLHEVNEILFSDLSFHVELLKNCPEAIPVLAEWIYEDWHSYDLSLTKENLIKGFNNRLNDDRLPLTFVALKGSTPVGVISLKKPGNEPEFSDLADGSPWGGSFHIIPEERNQGLGEKMAKVLVTVAKRLGYKQIYFYTSDPRNVGWYTERGAEIIDVRPFHGHLVTVMKFIL